MSTQYEPFIGKLLGPDIAEMLDAHETREVRRVLISMTSPDLADVLVALKPEQMALTFRILPHDRAAEVLAYLPLELQEQLVQGLNSEQLAKILDEMAPDDRAEFFEELPGQLTTRLLSLMRPEERVKTQSILAYPEESVGRWITPEYLTVLPEWTVQQALDHVRRFGRDAETLDTLYIVDKKGALLDDVRLRQLLLADPARTVEQLMDGRVISLRATDDQEQAVQVFKRYDRPVLPVVDRHNVLVGIVTFDDMADLAEIEATEDMHKMAGMEALETPYLSSSLLLLARKRGVWLSILFVGEMLTASAMTFFEGEIANAVVLALFIPLIISSGGNSGSQAASLIIRAMAVGEITLKDWWRVLRRELACGMMLGVLLGVIGMVRIQLWGWLGWANYTEYFTLVGVTVSLALTGVVLYGSVTGSMLPFVLKALGLDPATSSAPFVATLVDVFGLVIYFSVAAVILHGTLL